MSTIILSATSLCSFAAEDKIVRLIDLSPKEDTESSGSISSGNTLLSGSISPKILENGTKVTEKRIKSEKITATGSNEEENIQTLINSYILETYKTQGEKILKDLDQNLQKKIPDKEKRIKAYDSIQTTLELRKARILKVSLNENNKKLLSSYFDYMITALENRKNALVEPSEQ